MSKLKVAIIGSSGYTGVELIRILLSHSRVEISALIADSNAGKEIADIYPHLIHFPLPALKKLDEVDFSKIDVVFGCLPHRASQEIFSDLAKSQPHLKIIDLSGDFRFANPNDYESWYDAKHLAKDLQKDFVYGLTEINHDKIKKAKMVACPGCYPTSALLPLIPLVENGLISLEDIIIDSKSGVTGSGRSLKLDNLFCEASLKAYSISKHRHAGEIEQLLKSSVSQDDLQVSFTPHLIPVNRGILSTIYVKLADKFTVGDLKNCLITKYQDSFFVKITDSEVTLKDVASTNYCLISVHETQIKGRVTIISAIDNLVKGASGQAVQNMNLMFGLDEDEGLRSVPLVP